MDNVDPVLKELYVTMLESESYIKFASASKTFSDKLGNEIPESERISGNKILNWISGNIPKTQFRDFDEASSEYDNLVILSGNNINQNLGFFDYLGGTPPGTLLPILTPPQPEPTSCPKCTAQYNSCTSSADNTYADAVESASTQYRQGMIASYQLADMKASARVDWDNAYKRCTSAYNVCCIGN